MGSVGNRNNQHSFAQTPGVTLGRSQFDRSFARKDIIFVDLITPILVDEIIPGDTFNLNVNVFCRLATQLVPIMDNLYVDFFFFFVPNRLTWEHWEQFCGMQVNPGDSTDFTIPQLDAFVTTQPAVNTIFDKMGLPTYDSSILASGYSGVNALPFRAHNLIYNDWFRDENLISSITVQTDDGPDSTSQYGLQTRGKRFDYFTSSLVAPQKGNAVGFLAGDANVLRLSDATYWKTFQAGSNTALTSNPILADSGGNLNYTAGSGASLDPNGGLYADLTTAAGNTINTLRQAFQIQSLLELDNRGGTRYVEILLAHYGVTSPDFRLQRSEYLGGGQMKINSHPVPQTSSTDSTSPQGNLASFATGASRSGIGFTKSFVEHGYILGYACCRGDITYQQGLNKMWSRSTRYDFFWPKLQEIGEQAVLNREIFTQGTSADAEVFGYQERYAEYKYKPSEICGEFRSSYAQSLDIWHLAQYFTALPTLGGTFINQATPIGRALANPNAPQILIDMWFNLKCARPMLTYSVPASLGRF